MVSFDITLFVSFIAIIIAILGYWDNRKNINVVLNRESERKEIKEALKELKLTSDSLKKLPDYMCISDSTDIINDILREVYEKDELKLTITIQNLEMSIPNQIRVSKDFKFEKIKYDENTINVAALRDVIKKYIIIHNEGPDNETEPWLRGNANINLNVNPDVVSNNWIELNNFFSGLVKIEYRISKLNEFEYLIDSFDADIIKKIEANYEGILENLSDVLKKKVYTFEYDRNVKPSKLEADFKDVLNYSKISEKINYMSTEVASRIDNLRTELTKQILI